jgi:GNAT superfamily N-acetyltransferase
VSLNPDPRLVIRRAHSDDVPAVAAFQTRLWAEAYRGLVPQSYLDRMTVAEREVRWRKRVPSRRYRVLLAELEGRLVGVASARRAQPAGLPRLELRTLYVDAAVRGHGVAAALAEAAIGAADAFLWVFEENARARAFYAKHGFAPDGQRKLDPDTGVWEIRMVRR